MTNNTHLMTWVSQQTKERFVALARLQSTSESALLKRIVEASLATAVPPVAVMKPVESITPSGRMSVRLPDDDLLLLRER